MIIKFDSKFFEKREFDQKTIVKYFKNAVKDFKISSKNKEPEVIFNFSYSSMIKAGISLIALYGYRIKSRAGHHVKILEKLSQILNDKNIELIGDKMRKKRNFDFYDGGIIINLNEARQYLNFVKNIIIKAEKKIKHQNPLLKI